MSAPPKLTAAQVRARLQSIATQAVWLQDVDPTSEYFAEVWEDLVADVDAVGIVVDGAAKERA